MARADEIREDVAASLRVSDYEAVEVLWVALVKAANRLPGKHEHQRILSLVDRMPVEGARHILSPGAVDVLLNLDPSLETVLADDHEHLYPEATAAAFRKVRDDRLNSPKDALIALTGVLKRIRNKRVHGFKTRKGIRDGEILGAARPLLFELTVLAVEVVGE